MRTILTQCCPFSAKAETFRVKLECGYLRVLDIEYASKDLALLRDTLLGRAYVLAADDGKQRRPDAVFPRRGRVADRTFVEDAFPGVGVGRKRGRGVSAAKKHCDEEHRFFHHKTFSPSAAATIWSRAAPSCDDTMEFNGISSPVEDDGAQSERMPELGQTN